MYGGFLLMLAVGTGCANITYSHLTAVQAPPWPAQVVQLVEVVDLTGQDQATPLADALRDLLTKQQLLSRAATEATVHWSCAITDYAPLERWKQFFFPLWGMAHLAVRCTAQDATGQVLGTQEAWRNQTSVLLGFSEWGDLHVEVAYSLVENLRAQLR
jgi:hypothetical protein